MRPSLVALAEDVEQKEVDVVVERLVVEEHFRQVAQVLAVGLLFLPVDLEHGDGAVTVDLVAWGVLEAALFEVLEHLVSALEELCVCVCVCEKRKSFFFVFYLFWKGRVMR